MIRPAGQLKVPFWAEGCQNHSPIILLHEVEKQNDKSFFFEMYAEMFRSDKN